MGIAFSQSSDTSQSSDSSSGAPQAYPGPSILSRDRTLIGERGGKLVDFRYFGSVTGVYDSGLTPAITNSNGKLIDVGGAEGTEITFGVDANRQFKRDSFQIVYRGAYRHYFNHSYFDGTDQFLDLRYGRVLTRHLTFDFKTLAGITSLANGAFSYLPVTTNDLVAVPSNLLFDNRTYWLQNRASLIWQKSSRLSFSGGADQYLTRYRSNALVGITGFGGHGDVAYRLSRRQTIFVQYSFVHYSEQRIYSSANIHTMAAGYSLGLARDYDFSFSAGASALNYRGLEIIAVDPAIVAIIGQPTVTQSFNRSTVVPYGQARLIRRFERSLVGFDASVGISPGNGVYLTSRQQAANVFYDFKGFKRLTLGARFTYSTLSALGQSIGKYDNYQGGFGSTYRINNYLHAEFRYDYRHYTTQNAFFLKDSQRVSLGLAFSPGETPLSIW